MAAPASPDRSRPSTIALLVAVAFFMENLDGTVIATALPRMAGDFRTTPEALAIGMTAYLLTLAVFIPASGWVADRFGPRRVFAGAVAGFTLASILCGVSTGALGFTLARILQGAAGALMVPVGRLIVLRGTEKRDLLRAVAVITWPGLIAPVIGPPVGGFITHVASWRWIFFINVPIGAVELALIFALVRDVDAGARRPFDAIGFVLNGGALAGLLFALDRFGEAGADWRSPAAMLAISLGLGLAAVVHGRWAAHPLVAWRALANRTFAATMGAGSISRVAISTTPFLLPLLFQLGLGFDPFASGLLVLWYGVTNLGIKPWTTPILKRFGFRTVLVVNTLVNAAAIAACALIGRGLPIAQVAVLLMIAGASRSMQFTSLNTLAFAELDPSETSAANTLFNMAFQLAIGLGIAFGAIALRVLNALLPPGADPLTPFRITFVLAGLAMLGALPTFLRLHPDAGAAASGRARGRPVAG